MTFKKTLSLGLAMGVMSSFGFSSTIAFSKPEATQLKVFFQKNCIQCHGPEKDKGDFRADHLQYQLNNDHDAELWQEVLDVLNAGEMPPEDEE